jgi:hypothetical protein
MRIQIKRPPDAILARYYELWLAGTPSDRLAATLATEFDEELKACGGPREMLRCGKAYVAKHLPAFHTYCRTKFVEVTNKTLLETGAPAVAPLTAERRAELLHYVGMGASLSKAADLLNVPLVTITELWFKEDDTLQVELNCVRDRHDLRVVAALERRALGYDLPYEETRETNEESSNDKTGCGDKTSSTTVSGVRHYPASVTAQVHWTKNRLGWSDSPKGEGADAVQVEYDVRERLYDED